MISTAGLSATGVIPNAGSPAGMATQLTRLQQQLSDCVNCSTANTAEGKVKTQSITDQISALKSRIQESPLTSDNLLQGAQAAGNNQSSIQNRPIPGAPVGSVINISV